MFSVGFVNLSLQPVASFAEYPTEISGADPEIFERGGPEAIEFWKEGAQNPLKWLLNAHFSRFLVNLLQIFHKNGGPGPLGPSLKSTTELDSAGIL